MNEKLNAVRLRLAQRFASTPRPDYRAKPIPAKCTPCATTEYSPLTDELKEQQEQDRIKFNLPF